MGLVPRGSGRRPVGGHHEGPQRGVVRDRYGELKDAPVNGRTSPDAEATAPTRRPRTPGLLAPWIWNTRWIPGFLLAQVAVMLPFAEKTPASYQGVPGGLGALLSVAAAIVCGPLAGALISLVGGLVFVPLV